MARNLTTLVFWGLATTINSRMNPTLFVLYYLAQLVLGNPTLSSIHPKEEKINGGCQDFKAPLEYPFAWRIESVIEPLHGAMVRFSCLFIDLQIIALTESNF